jgi:hypothetical protein
MANKWPELGKIKRAWYTEEKNCNGKIPRAGRQPRNLEKRALLADWMWDERCNK